MYVCAQINTYSTYIHTYTDCRVCQRKSRPSHRGAAGLSTTGRAMSYLLSRAMRALRPRVPPVAFPLNTCSLFRPVCRLYVAFPHIDI